MLKDKEVSDLYNQNNLGEFENKIGLNFKNKSLLITALSHRSKQGDQLTSGDENLRLGLIGDKLIDLVLYDFVYREGASLKEMNDARVLTENEELNRVADDLGLRSYLFVDPSVNKLILKESQSFGSNSVEGLVGSIFIDRGFEAAYCFVKTWILPKNSDSC